MKSLKDIITEKLKISKTHRSSGIVFNKKDFLGDIIIEPIDDVKNKFENKGDKLTYYNVINVKDGDIIGVIEKNTNLYFNLIVSPQTYETVMGEKCTPSDTDYPDLPEHLQKNILKHYFTDLNFIHGGGIVDIDVFIKDKNEYNPDLYDLFEFQELLEYIKTTLE